MISSGGIDLLVVHMEGFISRLILQNVPQWVVDFWFISSCLLIRSLDRFDFSGRTAVQPYILCKQIFTKYAEMVQVVGL